jgi:ATP phosphoribosyltransferase
MSIRIALPKGRLLNDTAQLAKRAGWELNDYSEGTRLYYLNSTRFPNLTGKILHEKDIPIQVAMGSYDLGICGLDWIQELVLKYPDSGLVKLKDLQYGSLSLVLATGSSSGDFATLASIRDSDKVVSIASEYPHLAESLSLNCRFKRFNIFPIWGAAEIYPPENSDLVLISNRPGQKVADSNLIPIAKVLDSTAYLIANKTSLENKDLSWILDTIYDSLIPVAEISSNVSPDMNFRKKTQTFTMSEDSIRLALPDGHAQKHAVNILAKAGIEIKDYPSESGNRRPEIKLSGFSVKVIRPQDMPLQVANSKFDMAITGQDWVREHLYQFPSSPIKELVDLKYSKVKIVAAISNDLPANDIAGLRQIAFEKGWRIRVASEYTRIADKYARDNHLGMYRIIPTWGATEAFIPDDADMLIENTETGSTLKRHNLKIIETLFESTACLIASKAALQSPKKEGIESFASSLRKAVEEY